MNGLLKDLVVVELASVLAGPGVGMFFAEHGATVIKVENPATGGDITRSWKLTTEPKGSISAYFSSVNWGKRSVALDYKSEADMEIVHELIKKADIVLSSFKPGDDSKFRLDYNSCRTLNPGLIYGAITAYGPDDKRVGFDAVLQAETGFTYMNGKAGPEGESVKMPVALIDVLAGHQLKEGLLLALLGKRSGEVGTKVEVSLYDSAIASLVNQATNYLVAGVIPSRMGSEHPNIVPYGNILYDKEGFGFVIACGSNSHFQNFCKILDLRFLEEIQDYNSNSSRVKNRRALITILETASKNFSRDDILKQCMELKVPAGPLNNMEKVMQNPMSKRLHLRNAGSELEGIRSSVFKMGNHPLSGPICAPPELDKDRNWVLEFIK